MLQKNWITEKNTDFEYKQYLLLGYLQKAYSLFDQLKFYPIYDELSGRYYDLLKLNIGKKRLLDSIPKDVLGLDWKRKKLIYESLSEGFDLHDIDDIVSFSLPRLKTALDTASKKIDEVSTSFSIEPIGVIPLYQDEGYLLMKNSCKSSIIVFQYSSIPKVCDKENFSNFNYNYSYVGRYNESISSTYTSIKLDLRVKNEQLPSPATYLISTDKELPLRATFLPTAYQLFEQYHQP